MAEPYISEVKYLGGAGQDFIEVAVDVGTDVSNIEIAAYRANGTVRTVSSLGTKVATVGGKDIYVVDKATSATFLGLGKTGGVALVDDGTVVSFVSFDDNASTITATNGPAAGSTSTDIGEAGNGESLETTDGGASYSTQTSPTKGTIPCFLGGTLIDTEFGERPIETLSVGDQVVTSDRGLQPIRWIGEKKIDGKTASSIDVRPICIKANSFGAGLPHTDLFLSPNHRVLIRDYKCQLLFAETEVLSAVKFLTDRTGIFRDTPKSGFSYYHILFDQHEVLMSNGMATESFHPGQIGLDGFGSETGHEILCLFPELRYSLSSYGQTVRRDLRRFEADVLAGSVLQSSWNARIGSSRLLSPTL